MARRDLTAMARRTLSRPIQIALEHGILAKGTSILDYGCGRGYDVDSLKSQGWAIRGWDPVHRPTTRRSAVDVVTLIYVINVIEREDERLRTIQHAWKLARQCLVVAARLEHERDEAHIRPAADGWMTLRGTFQRFYEQDDLQYWIQHALGREAIVAAPGVFYVFKDQAAMERFKARRYRVRIPAIQTRIADQKFLDHADLLEPLMSFVAAHGRVPRTEELADPSSLVEAFGSIKHAFRVVQHVTDKDEWSRIADRRRIDLLVHMALRSFDGDYRMKDLPRSTQFDVRTFFQSFRRAHLLATRLLFSAGSLDAIQLACRSSNVGKLTPTALYVHKDFLHGIPALLKVYEACARRVIGEVPEANLIKLHRDTKKVSYLAYPAFWDDPHPPLEVSFLVDLVAQRFHVTSFARRANRPILHRKEEFIASSHDKHATFAALTRAEVEAGLYADPSAIGTEHQWRQALAARSVTLEGHALVPVDGPS